MISEIYACHCMVSLSFTQRMWPVGLFSLYNRVHDSQCTLSLNALPVQTYPCRPAQDWLRFKLTPVAQLKIGSSLQGNYEEITNCASKFSIGVGIDISVHHILDQINIARRCQKELNSLSEQVRRIEPIVNQIQQYRLQLNWKKGIRNEAPAVNEWLTKLEGLLRQASAMAQKCTIPSWDVVSRHKTSKSVMKMSSEICQHLDSVPLMSWASILKELADIREMLQSSASSSAISSATASQPPIASTGFFIKEPLIVGQDSALSALQKLVIDETADSPFSRIGVLGKGGSGKTLLLKALLNCKEVRDFFSDQLFLWLTVSQSPSFTSLLNELSTQVASYMREDLDKNMSQEAWLNERMKEKRFVLILDDVWEKGAEVLEELGLLRLTDPSNSKVIVSSRSRSGLLEMGVPEKFMIRMADLDEDDSWQLFAYHAFSYNNGNLPTNIHEGTAKLVCTNCGGLPLVIKAVARAMAGTTYADDWELAVQRLPIANSEDKDAVFHRLRLSYDSLARSYGVNLQMCFLYLAAFKEDQIIRADIRVIPLWTGAGLLGMKKLQNRRGSSDPFETGKRYVNILADSCLIEPIHRDADGNVTQFRMHDVIRDLAIQIAEQEEKFYCGTSRGLATLAETECSGCTRILLNHNSLTSLPESLTSNEICSLMVGKNKITGLPRTLVGGMSSLTVLDLSFTLLSSLPDSVGRMKQLVFLDLTEVPITALPPSLTNLVNLQMLNLSGTKITELPYDIHKLISLTYLFLYGCRNLRCLPQGISRLASLQHLVCFHVMWTEHRAKHGCKRVASINDLGKLTELKGLYLHNKGQAISDGTFGNLAHVETLELALTAMTDLPHDITNMSKLKRFHLFCPDLVEIGSNFGQFQCLTHLRLIYCINLEEVPHLHELKNLRQLDILHCDKIRTIPKEFGRSGSFPLLEIFSLVGLYQLKELPILEEGALPSLKVFTLMKCEALERLPKSYLDLRTLQKIRVYGCSIVLANLNRMENTNGIEVVSMSIEDTIASENYYSSISGTYEGFYDKSWCNELHVFLHEVDSKMYI